MNNADFVEATSKLEHYFDKEYKTDQLKIMFDFFKSWSIEKYRKAINYCIKNNKYLPKIADLTNADIDFAQVKNKENLEFTKCNKCNGEGFIKYFKTIQNGEKPITYEYIAFCTCENAKMQREINKYDLPTLAEVGM